MNTILLIGQIIAAVAGGLIVLICIPLFFSFRWPAVVMWGLKLYVSALASILFLISVVISITGLLTTSVWISGLGILTMIMLGVHILGVTRPPDMAHSFERAFGSDWEKNIPSEQKTNFLSKRMSLLLPAVPKPQFQQDLEFAVIPGSNRKLLCDIWQPAENAPRSGLAFIYLHGSAFYFLDKDYGTRPFFRHLAAEGHVIMDVAYRLAPETDIMGMVHDVKRAILWIKEHAATYKVDPNRVIVGGGSAGASLSLLAAYTDKEPQFLPEEARGKNVSVCGVVSLYGPTDLKALYYHTKQHLTTRVIPGKEKKSVPKKMPAFLMKSIAKDSHRLGLDKGLENVGTLAPLLGGHPDECPGMYAMFSPLTHVHADCPPTLLIHGQHDIMSPVRTTGSLYERLIRDHIPAVMHILPQTDHAFDLVLPKINLAAHNAIYDVERFLSLISLRKVKEGRTRVVDACLQPTFRTA